MSRDHVESKIIDMELARFKNELLRYRESLKEKNPNTVSRQAVILNDLSFDLQQNDPVLSAAVRCYATTAALGCRASDINSETLNSMFTEGNYDLE